jgi:hypothetical protein
MADAQSRIFTTLHTQVSSEISLLFVLMSFLSKVKSWQQRKLLFDLLFALKSARDCLTSRNWSTCSTLNCNLLAAVNIYMGKSARGTRINWRHWFHLKKMPDFSCNSCESDDMWRPMFINRRKENKTLLKEETETMPYCFMQPYFLLRFATCSFATLSFGAPVAWRRWTSALLDCHYRLPKESSWLHGNIKVHNVTIYVNWPVFNLALQLVFPYSTTWYWNVCISVLLGINPIHKFISGDAGYVNVTRFCLQRYLHSIDDKDSEPITNSLRPFIDGILHVSQSPLSIVITLSSRRLQDFQKHSLGYFRFVRVLFCPHHVIWKKPVKERKTRVSRLYLVMVKPALDRVPSRKLENVMEGRRLFISIVSDTFRYLFSIGTLIASLTVFVYIFFRKKSAIHSKNCLRKLLQNIARCLISGPAPVITLM